jgi:hypothetical protein
MSTSTFWGVIGCFTIVLALIAFIIVLVVLIFTGKTLNKLLTWALSSLNFNQILTNTSASNKAAFNSLKATIIQYLQGISLFGPPPKKLVPATTSRLYGQFFSFVGLKLVAVLIQTFLGVYALWLCKVAQSNILPSDFRGAPYTDLPPIIESIMTQVNFFKLNGQDYSTKLLFQYLYVPDKSANDTTQINSQFSILNALREYNELPTITGTSMFFIYMIESIFCLNFSMINMFFSAFNSLYEWILVLFGGYLLLFVFTINVILTNIIFIYIYFAGIFSWIWKLNKPQVVVQDDEKFLKPNFAQNWVYITITSMPFTWLFTLIETIFIVNLFGIFLMLGNMFCFPVVILYSLICGSFITAKVVEGFKIGENYTFLTLYVNKMRYMIIPICLFMSIYVVIGANCYLGKNEMYAAIVATIIVLLVLINVPITNVNDFGSKDTEPYNYTQADKRTQFKQSNTVLWALTGAMYSADLAINLSNQLNKLSKFDNHVNEVKQSLDQQPSKPMQMGGNTKNYHSESLIKKMQALNNKIRENMIVPTMSAI